MVASGLPLTLLAMDKIAEVGNDFSRGVSTEWDVFPDEPITHKYLLG